MAKKHKKPQLTAEAIRNYIDKEDAYVVQEFLKRIKHEEIVYALVPKKHKIPLHIKI